MKKRTLITSAIVLVLLVALGAAIVAFFAPLRDIPPVSDAHLLRVPVVIAAEQNAYTYYSRAAEHLACPKEDKWFARMSDADAAGEADVRATLEKNAKVFALIARGNRCARCVTPPMATFDAPVPYLRAWRMMAHLMVLKAVHHAVRGEPGEAVAAAREHLGFAALVEADAGSLIHYLVALVMRRMATDTIADLVRRGALPGPRLAELQRALEDNPPSTQGFVLAMKTEYELTGGCVDAMRSGRASPAGGPVAGGGTWQAGLMTRLMLLPNRTKNLLVKSCTELIDHVDRPYAETRMTDFEAYFKRQQALARSAGGIARFVTPNLSGLTLCGLLIPAHQPLVKSRCTAEAAHSATRTLIALHRFRIKTGAFPETLDALVPDYLSAVQRDPYDGKPLRYSREKGVVYSVGVDLEDSGGVSDGPTGENADATHKGKDIVFRITATSQPASRSSGP